MYLTTISIFGLFVATLSLCQDYSSAIFIPNVYVDPQQIPSQTIVASIAGSGSGTTLYAFHCEPGADTALCGFSGTATLTEGPTGAAYTIPPQIDANNITTFSGSWNCTRVLASAVCAVSMNVPSQDPILIPSSTISGSHYSPVPVLITGSSVVASNTRSSKTEAAGAGAIITGSPAWMIGGAALAARKETPTISAGFHRTNNTRCKDPENLQHICYTPPIVPKHEGHVPPAAKREA
ncbi:hypothetical protein BDZ45DRAFT_745997 [Acephala macrosclerotiorum]|nr:hypothetical protein BDZ45DRAFT_745997 [Acephala macrosclerotiorum]